jgi:hypothetical protein
MTLVLATIASMLSKDVSLIAQMEQRPVVVVASQNDRTTLATVATIRTTVGVILDVLQVHTSSTTLS